MPYQTSYVNGDCLKICDVCGFQYKGSQLRKRWDGMMVCRDDFEERHPQDYMVRARADKQSVKNARPDPEPVFISPSKGEDL